MSQDAIQNVRATQALRADNDTPIDDLKHGEFVLDELKSGDLEARLKGDGIVTPTDAAKRLISLNPTKTLLAAMGDDDAALFGATLAMRTSAKPQAAFERVRNPDQAYSCWRDIHRPTIRTEGSPRPL